MSSPVTSGSEYKSQESENSSEFTSPFEFPVVFLSHAAPNLFMEAVPVMGTINDCGVNSPTYKWYEGLAHKLGLVGERKPKAIVTVTAHWITNRKEVSITAQNNHPTLYYDYYGFPKHLYDIKYPCPGSVQLAQRIKTLLEEGPHHIKAQLDSKRNIDHGAFIPLKLIYPAADIPVIQVSIDSSFDPLHHIQLGESLAPLRKEGVLIIGSGQASHNAFHTFGKAGVKQQTQKFINPLSEGLAYNATPQQIAEVEKHAENVALGKTLDETDAEKKANIIEEEKMRARNELFAKVQQQRIQTALEWSALPNARVAHPQEDHLVPIFACIGAANGSDKASIIGDHWMMGTHSLRSFAWGTVSNASKAPEAESTPSSSGEREL